MASDVADQVLCKSAFDRLVNSSYQILNDGSGYLEQPSHRVQLAQIGFAFEFIPGFQASLG